MNTKFSLTKETKIAFGITLYRIKAKKDFGNVIKGELGGWVEKEENIAVSGDAWVSDNARVSDNAWVSGKFRLKVGWCFGRKQKDWDVSEVENGDGILLIKDYEPVKEETPIVEIICEGKTVNISRESAIALNLLSE